MATAPRPLRVLVVDDHADSIEALTRLLRGDGCEPLRAGGVEEAFDLALDGPVDVLVSDLDLTDGDGCELLVRVRAVHPQVRGIAVTGHAGEKYERMCREAGYEQMFLKPVLFGELRDALFDPAPPSLGGVPAPRARPVP